MAVGTGFVAAAKSLLGPNGTSSRCKTERVDALKRAEKDADAALAEALAEARRLEEKAREAHRCAFVDANDRARGAFLARRADLEEDVERQLLPLLAKFSDEPRKSAKAICAAWQELDARAREELGNCLGFGVLVRGLLLADREEIPERVGFYDLKGTEELLRALEAGQVALVEQGLRALEIAVSRAYGTDSPVGSVRTGKQAIESEGIPQDHAIAPRGNVAPPSRVRGDR